MKVFLPGITDTKTLKTASELCGQAAFTERVRSRGPVRGAPRAAAGLARRDTPDMIRQLPAGFAPCPGGPPPKFN